MTVLHMLISELCVSFCELPNWSLRVKPEVILSALILLRPLCCWHPVREENQTLCLSITKHEKWLHLRLWGFGLRARRSGWGRECACEQTFFIRYVKDREKQNNELWWCWNVQSRRTPVYDTGDHILILFFRSEMVRCRFRPAWTTARYEVYILQDDKKMTATICFCLCLQTHCFYLIVFSWSTIEN